MPSIAQNIYSSIEICYDTIKCISKIVGHVYAFIFCFWVKDIVTYWTKASIDVICIKMDTLCHNGSVLNNWKIGIYKYINIRNGSKTIDINYI